MFLSCSHRFVGGNDRKRVVLDMRNGRCLRPAMVLKAEAFMAAFERHLDLLDMREAA